MNFELITRAKSEVLHGERLTLRPLTVADATDRYASWMNDPRINQYLESRFSDHTVADLRRFVEAMIISERDFIFAMETEQDGHIGNIKLGGVDWFHRYGDVGLLIGEEDCWGKGFATEAISLVTRFGFETLGLHKITAGCYGTNMGSARAFLKSGWVKEGVRRSHYRTESGYVDSILLATWNPEENSVSAED